MPISRLATRRRYLSQGIATRLVRALPLAVGALAISTSSAAIIDLSSTVGAPTVVPWLTGTSWVGGVVPGSADVANFANTVGAGSVLGIDFGGATNNGAANQIVGAITLSGSSDRTLGASSATDGVLTLQGVGGVLLSHAGSGNLVVGPSVGGATGRLSLNLAAPGSVEVASSGNVTLSAAITGSSGLTKTGSGAGALILSGANTFTGATSLSGGNVTLDYTAQNNPKLDAASALTLGGVNLAITPNAAADTAQAVASTTLAAGSTTITVSRNAAGNNTTLDLKTLTRNGGGTLNVIYAGSGSGTAAITTNSVNTNGILGGWATFNGRDWAANSTNAADGAITALSTYTLDAFAAGNNTDITIAGAGPGNPAATINSLRFNQLGAKTLGLGTNAKTITSSGILITPNVGAFTTTINGSNLRGASGADLVFHQHNTAGDVAVGAVITNTAAGGLLKTGPGVLVLSGTNTFTGAVTVNQGVLSVGTVTDGGTNSPLGAGTSLTLGSGAQRGTLSYTGANGSTNRAVALGGAGGAIHVATAGSTLTLSGALSGNGTLLKSGFGAVTLSGANPFTGSTTVLGGTLTLDYTAANSAKLNAAAPLTVSNGTLALTSNATADTTQTILSTSLTGGANAFTVTKNAGTNNATLNLNAITRAAGATANFAYSGTGTGIAAITTDTTNTNSILGGWATFNGTDWAVNSTNAADGRIDALAAASYYPTTAGGNTAANYASRHVDVTSSPTVGAAISPFTARFNAAAANTLTLTATNTFGGGGILVTPAVGANLSTITGGTIRGAANSDLVVNQFNTSGDLTINSIIGNNTSTRLVKTGPGNLNLGAVNTFVGGLAVNQGTVTVTGTLANNATNTITINNGGTLRVDRENFIGNYNVAINTLVVIHAGGTLTNNGNQYNTLGALTLNGGTLTAIGGRNANFQSWGLLNTVTVTGDLTSTISATGTNNGVQLGHVATTSVTFDVADGAAGTDLAISAPLKNGRNAANDNFITSSLVKTGAGTLVSSGANTFTGDVTVNGGTLRLSGTNTLGGAVTVNGGTLQLANATTGIANGVTVNGGTLLVTTAAIPNVATNTVTVNSGGSYVFGVSNVYGNFASTPVAPIVVNAGGTVTNNGAFYSALGPVTLNGGTLTSTGGFDANYRSWGLKGTVTVNGGATTSVISGAGTNVGVGLGAATVNGATFDVADGAAATDLLISVPLTDGINVANTGTQQSSLTKTGVGLAQLNATNTYTGATLINAGTLAIGPAGSIASSSTIQIAPGAVLDVSATSFTLGAAQTLRAGRTTGFATDVAGSWANGGTISPGGDGTAATLTLSGGLTLNAGGNLRFDFGADGTVGGGLNDLTVVGGALNATGVTTIVSPTSVPVSGVTYTLISAATPGTASAANFAFGSSGTRQTYVFDTTTTPGAVLLTATGSAANLIWNGAVDGAWDVNTTANWSGAADQKFFNLDNVTFDDTSAVGSVVLGGNVQPLSVTVNNTTTAYSFTGAGGLIGTTGLVKTGSGTLTIGTTNSATGVVEVRQGTLSVDSVSNAGSASALGAGSSVVLGAAGTAGTLRFSPAASGTTNKTVTLQAGGGAIDVADASGVLAVSGVVSGGGTLTKSGTGVLVLSGQNTFSGVTTVSGGTLRAGHASALGASGAGTVIQSGATLDVNAFNLGVEAITVAGPGVGGSGAIVNGSATTQDAALRIVTLAGDTTFGGTGRWGITGTGTAGTSTLDLAGFKLTKTGSNYIRLNSTNVTSGDIEVNGGTLNFNLGTSVAGTGTITINTGGTITTSQNGLGNTVTRPITLAGGTLANEQNSTVASPITLAASTASTITNLVNGTYNLTGAVTGSGDVTISTGTSAITNISGAISSTGNVTLTANSSGNTTLNGGLSGPANVTLTNTGSGTATVTTVAGNSITGALSASGVALNIAGIGTAGTFTTGGGLTLGGTTGVLRFDLSTNSASGNDQLVVGGALSLSGTTTINVNALGASLRPTAGAYTLVAGSSLAAGDTTNLALTGIPANTRQTFALDTTTTPGSVLLNVTGSTAALTWSGPGSWDTNTSSNWNAGAEKFFTWDAVTFDDSSANGAVALTTTVTPSSVTVNNSNGGTAYTISGTGGVIAGTGSFLKAGTGVVTLSNANTFTGGAVLRSGEVRLTNAAALGAGSVTLGDASTGSNNVALYLETNRTSFTRAITVTNNGTGTATIGSRSTVTGTGDNNNFTSIALQRDVVFDSNAADRTDYRNITGTGNITIAGTGRTLIGGTNSFLGDIKVNSGAFLQTGAATAGSTNFIPDTSSLTVESGGRYALSSGAETIDDLNGAGTVDVAGISGTLTVGAGGGSGSFSGTLANNGANVLSLTKTGSGGQTIAGSSTYTGPTAVNGGLLTIAGGLDGTSQINVNGGTLLLGASDVLNNNASLRLNGGTFDLGGFSEGTETTPGLGALILSASSTLDFGAGASLLHVASLGPLTSGITLTITNWNPGDRLIISGNEATRLSIEQSLATAGVGISFNGNGEYAAVQFDANHFEIVPVPEPTSTALVGSAMLLGLIGYRERRRAGRRRR